MVYNGFFTVTVFLSEGSCPVHTGADPSESKFKNSSFLSNMNPNFLIKINLDGFLHSGIFISLIAISKIANLWNI